MGFSELLEVEADVEFQFDSIIFNFPYADVQNSSVSDGFSTFWVSKGRHQALLKELLRNARHVLKTIEGKDENESNSNSNSNSNGNSHGHSNSSGELKPSVFVTLLMTQAISWGVESIAASENFSVRQMFPFEAEAFSALGYSNRRTYADMGFALPSRPSSLCSPPLSLLSLSHPGSIAAIADRVLKGYRRGDGEQEIAVAWTFEFVPL